MAATKKGRCWLKGEETNENEEEGELLVFGYSCKLFRDDEKALYVDQGKHLIPWMGQENHMIDRYDGRGYIHDLQQYEPVPGRDVWQEMSEEERHMESVCDEERYAALKTDPVERDLYHEEEIKRLRAALADDGVYNQVGFSYDDSGSVQNQSSQQNTTEGGGGGGSSSNDEADEEFVAPKELNVPPTMEIPSSNKVNAIVEKTALFVVRQGTQMEIVIKAKQASNPQFGFLAFDHPLNPYYKHVIQAVKQGKYIPKPPPAKGDEDGDEDDDSEGEGHYLHPSLLSAKKEKELNVPKLNYTRTGDDSYSILVSRLKDKVQMDIQQQQQNLAPPEDPSKSHFLPNAPSSDATVHPPPLPSNPLPPGLEPVTLPTELTQDDPPVLWPPPDLVPIIDKMASYVAKNGQHFESVVKSKSLDSRFEFLTVGHPYYPYYQFKRMSFEKECSQMRTSNSNDTLDDRELKTGVVSFSIKMKDNGEKLKTFTLGGSDGEEGIDVTSLPLVNKEAEAEETLQQKQLKAKLEEVKLAEQRIKDKLAAAARERLAQASREKQLQLERKRKAALFLTMLRKDKEEDDEPIIGPRLPNAMEMTQMIIREDSPPLAALVACAADSKRLACEGRHSLSPRQERRERRRRSRSTSASPRRRPRSRSERHKRSSRSTSREITGSRRRRHRRRSRSRSTKRRSHDRSSRERKKTTTPPASYSRKRRSSKSPRRHSRRTRSHSRRRSISSSRTKQSKNGRRRSSSSSSSSDGEAACRDHSRSRSGSRRSKSVSRNETQSSSKHTKRKKL